MIAMSAFTPAQRHHAIGLYRRLVRTANETFAGDVSTAQAWRTLVRKEFLEARGEQDAEKIESGLAKWEDVIKVLRHNVVQGRMNSDSSAFALKFTPDTELGSNESIRAGREKQLNDLRASKGSAVGGCGGASTKTQVRSFSTSCISRASTSKAKSAAQQKDVVENDAWNKSTLPRPIPHFGQTVLLSDGSSIQLFTTSPRGTVRMTRDPTNHPLWNPHMERRAGAGDEDESGRLARFRRRFGGADNDKAGSATNVAASVSAKGTTPSASASSIGRSAAKKSTSRSTNAGFSTEDFDWMSVGGREAPAGKVVTQKKGKK